MRVEPKRTSWHYSSNIMLDRQLFSQLKILGNDPNNLYQANHTHGEEKRAEGKEVIFIFTKFPVVEFSLDNYRIRSTNSILELESLAYCHITLLYPCTHQDY